MKQKYQFPWRCMHFAITYTGSIDFPSHIRRTKSTQKINRNPEHAQLKSVSCYTADDLVAETIHIAIY
jgi:hypothetical protein